MVLPKESSSLKTHMMQEWQSLVNQIEPFLKKL
jgi:hypothetical protein